MPQIESLPGRAWRRGPAMFSGCDADHNVVWVRGAQDASTAVALCLTVARAIAFDDTDLVIDLRDVTFIDTATVAVLIRAEAFLQERSRSLTLRSPSAQAWRVLRVGGLADLVDPRPTTAPSYDNGGSAGELGGVAHKPESPPTSPSGGASADAGHNAEKHTIRTIGRGDTEQLASQTGTVTAAPRASTAHDSAVSATIAAAYDLAAGSGSIGLRSYDLLRRLHRSASVLREATARVEQEVRADPSSAAAGDALALLHEVRRIGLFYEGSF
jgi:anti-anti-sigma factor